MDVSSIVKEFHSTMKGERTDWTASIKRGGFRVRFYVNVNLEEPDEKLGEVVTRFISFIRRQDPCFKGLSSRHIKGRDYLVYSAFYPNKLILGD